VAKHSRLKQGDRFTVQWRDAKGAFDAAEVRIVGVFKSNVPAVDNRQLWIPLQRLREMMVMPDEATLVVVRDEARHSGGVPGWFFRDQGYLLADVDRLIRQKSIGQSIFYVVLLMLAMLAIFDTQVLSVFRRQKEIGTHIALGMTRGQVVRLFTLEGAMHGLLAAVAAAVYGIPLLWLQATRGFTMPEATDDLGVAIAEKIFPVYSLGLVLGTVCIVLTATTVVSFLPSRRIAKMNPTDALRGKIP
jgi:ABC-type lipoprotein release transport system permease subunit